MCVNFAGLHISDLEIGLKFNIETTAKLEPAELIHQIYALLKASNYKVTKQNDLFIEFEKDSPSRYESFYMIDDGKFELERVNKGPLLRLTFIISIWNDLLFIIPFTLAGIFFNHFALIIAAIFAIQSLIKIPTIKKTAEELFNNIISLDNLHI